MTAILARFKSLNFHKNHTSREVPEAQRRGVGIGHTPISLGWECPRCGSTHAPQVVTCGQCNILQYPQVPNYLIRVLEHEITDAEAKPIEDGHVASVRVATHHLRRLLEGVKPKVA